MAITVSFVKASTTGTGVGSGVSLVRAMEVIAVGATTSATAQSGEYIIIGNAETSMIRVAFGTTPDADATAANGTVTSAGYPVSPGAVSDPIIAPAGAKINAELAD